MLFCILPLVPGNASQDGLQTMARIFLQFDKSKSCDCITEETSKQKKHLTRYSLTFDSTKIQNSPHPIFSNIRFPPPQKKRKIKTCLSNLQMALVRASIQKMAM
uniref:Uncharacterized protein n=1 Tax=Opuntia streptacantha TaxID=393608 RepID=A0A7C9CGE3_OPUST